MATERSRPAIVRRRAQWRQRQKLIDPSRLVFIDETWTKTNMAPLRGWGMRGQRLVADAPYGHWNTTTFIAALRVDRIDAPWLLDGPMNGDSFQVYVEQILAPTLKPGDIVIADNLSTHKNKEARRAIRKAGARLILLPKYSPDLNPIEQLFAKFKHLLRKAMARDRDGVESVIRQMIENFNPKEAKNYFDNAGYTQT